MCESAGPMKALSRVVAHVVPHLVVALLAASRARSSVSPTVPPLATAHPEWFDGRDLAVYCDRPRLFAELWAIPGVRRHQTGDQEMRATCPPEALEQVAAVIHAKRWGRTRQNLVPDAGQTATSRR
jgi:hypothetical protein